jgi:hypothetical protein
MRNFALSRLALRISISAALLSGCGGSQTPIGASGAIPQATARGAHTGESQPPSAPAARQGPCMYLLSKSQVSNLSYTQISGPDCFFYINDTANMSYSTITAAKILYAGQAPNETGATFPEATPAPGPAVNDPCPKIRGCSYLKNHPPSTSNCKSGGPYMNVTLSPGCYHNLNLSGTDRLKPGLYVINGAQFHLQASNVRGRGVTIYLTASVSDTNFSSSSLALSAPVRGKYKDVLFYRPPQQNNSINFSTCTCNLTGILYFPTAQVDYSSNSGNYQLLIFGQANISTSIGLRFGRP